MHEYAFDTELVRVAILLGVVASMLFYERYGVTTGGAIVPGYMAMFVTRPTHIAATCLIAILTYLAVHKVLRPRWMLWGRRLFEAEILISLILQGIWIGLLFLLGAIVPQLGLLSGIGFVLPGIIAHDMGRQGVKTTVWTSLVCTLTVFGVVVLIGAVRDVVGLPRSLSGPEYRALVDTYAFPTQGLIAAIIVSVLASIALYHGSSFRRLRIPTSLRTGGFVTAGYLALFLNRPMDLLFVLFCGALTYVFVTRFLMKKAILFGRSKMAVMILAGITITWLFEIVIDVSGWHWVPWLGFNAIAPTIAALLANDAQRQGPLRTLLGTGASTLIVFILVSFFFMVTRLAS